MNLRANFDKNKKVSRIKALREFTMKRLTDFFGEKGWKTGKMGYNENRKRSKYCCWTVPMSDWNSRISSSLGGLSFFCWTVPMSDWNQIKHTIGSCTWFQKLNRTYEWLKPDWDPSGRRPSFRVEPYLWVICCFCWTHCFIRILWIVSLIFKENTNKKMLQLIKSWSFFVKKFWLQEVGMYLQWRRCCPREIREMLLIISVWKRMGVALMVCRFLSWRINGRLIMSR